MGSKNAMCCSTEAMMDAAGPLKEKQIWLKIKYTEFRSLSAETCLASEVRVFSLSLALPG